MHFTCNCSYCSIVRCHLRCCYKHPLLLCTTSLVLCNDGYGAASPSASQGMRVLCFVGKERQQKEQWLTPLTATLRVATCRKFLYCKNSTPGSLLQSVAVFFSCPFFDFLLPCNGITDVLMPFKAEQPINRTPTAKHQCC